MVAFLCIKNIESQLVHNSYINLYKTVMEMTNACGLY